MTLIKTPLKTHRPTHRRSSSLTLVVCVLGLLLGTLVAEAQARPGQQRPGQQRARGSAIERILFPPELVMRHQAEIDLSEEQRQAVVTEVQSLQSDMVPLQFELGEAMEGLGQLLRAPTVDEAAAVAHVEKITALESRIKRRHFQLLIRIKNLLRPEQQQSLRRLRRGR